MYSKRIVAALSIFILTVLVISGMSEVSAIEPPSSDLNVGPYVDKIVYKVIANQDQRILALQAGEIEMDTSFIDPVYLNGLDFDPDIDIFSAVRNGYGHITINCRDYPLNISGLRRAFAFTFDKTRVTGEIFDGFSQEHDSLVPYTNGWCIEDDFDWRYYDDRADIGNQILDDHGFEINETTGFRNAPNGEPFDIAIGYASSSPEIAGGTCQIGVDALHALHIDARKEPVDYNDGIDRFEEGIVDMIFYATNFYSNDVDWLANEYWSENADNPDVNPTKFANATYDSWRDQLLYSTTYEEVYEAAAEMQKILHYNVPLLVVYENTYMQGYRNDVYTGYVEDLGRYISGPWTMRKIHKLDGTLGGTVPIAISQEPDSFNIYVTNSAYSATILTNLYSSLYSFGPDLNPWPDLAINMITETHSDNAAVPEGHTRFTIDIIQNATWTDGTPLTATDVAFTYTYQYESAAFGNPAGDDMSDFFAAYAPNPYRVVLEFSTESYWHFSNFAYNTIIPEHIFNDDTGIGYEGWDTWNPVFDPEVPHVTSGPFIFTDYEAGEWYEITRNPQYYYHPADVHPLPEEIKPVVQSVIIDTYVVGTTGNEIVWEVVDNDPRAYSIYRNGSLVSNGNWHGSDIVLNIDGLSVGTYNYTLHLLDYSSNLVTNSVIVHVVYAGGDTSNISTTGGIVYDLLNAATSVISITSSCVIVIVLVLYWKSKQSEGNL